MNGDYIFNIYRTVYYMFEKKYKLIKILGEGTFGKVYKGKNLRTNEYVAIKSVERKASSLKNEIKICNHLANIKGIYKLRWYGSDLTYNYAVFDLLGPSLKEELREKGIYDYRTLVPIATQIITIIEHIHKRGILHRDIKLENFMLGLNDKDTIYLIDYGLSKSYLRSNEHIKKTINTNNIVGTTEYISPNVHEGMTPSRRDDLISVGYIFVHMLLGELPWKQLVNDKTIIIYKQAILQKNTAYEIPNEIREFLTIVNYLEYKDTPPYKQLQHTINNVIYNQPKLKEYPLI